MGMDTWVIGQISFWYTVYEVRGRSPSLLPFRSAGRSAVDLLFLSYWILKL
jgi:hypothetical protein